MKKTITDACCLIYMCVCVQLAFFVLFFSLLSILSLNILRLVQQKRNKKSNAQKFRSFMLVIGLESDIKLIFKIEVGF